MADSSTIEQVAIDHVGHRGDGVVRGAGAPLFVPYALPGEIVSVDLAMAESGRARLLHIARASPERVDPFCAHFGVCGGCAIQHWQPAPYRSWKRQLVVEALAQAGIDGAVDDLIDAHGEGRRRLTAHARRGGEGVLHTGFAAAGSHAIVPLDGCPILVPELSGAFDIARAVAEVLKPAAKPLDIQITATETGPDVDVRGSGPLSPAMTSALAQLAERLRLSRLTRHGELVLMRAPPVIAMGPARVTLPPASFLQATRAGEETLGDLVVAHCGKASNVADLFCGVGPFALRLAQRRRVAAFDSDAGAVEALAKAVRGTPKLKPVMAKPRDLFRRPLAVPELRSYDAVVFDPPRQGAAAQTAQLANSRVPIVVAVSCNAATFARDARTLIDGGYRLERITPVDQFRHSAHVEIVARFARG